MLSFIEEILLESRKIISEGYSSISKKSSSQFVTDTDLAVEKFIVSSIRERFPESGIISEEMGKVDSKNNSYFIIDPIDGTSNYMSGLSWFGIMICYFESNKVQYSGVYLPITEELYLAGLDKGATRNGVKFVNANTKEASEYLVSYCVDNTEDNFSIDFKKELYSKILGKFLNIRSTNSAVDYVYSCEGKMSLVNLDNKIWDIAPVSLIASESGNVVTDAYGQEIKLDINNIKKSYSIVVSDKKKHDLIIGLINEVR